MSYKNVKQGCLTRVPPQCVKSGCLTSEFVGNVTNKYCHVLSLFVNMRVGIRVRGLHLVFYPSEGYLRHWRVQAGGFARHSLCWCFDLARPAFWKPFGGLWGLFLASFFYPSEGYLRHYLLFFSTRDRFIGLAAQALSRTAAQTVLTVVLPPPPPPNLFTGGRREGAVALKYEYMLSAR